MKSAAAAFALTGGGIFVAAFVLVDVAAAFSLLQIGGTTEITGITVAGLLVAAGGAMAAIVAGGRYLVRFGGKLAKWQEALDGASELGPMVRANTEAITANAEAIVVLSRWRDAVGPIVTEWERRLGIEAMRQARDEA